MKKFLLLRSNKQSGPYSADELQQMGLKPYDLIWVEGKSAAWRYPGEIEELKSFAPAVEEQPYDRFYKKSSDPEHKTRETVQTPVVTASPVQPQPLADKPVKKEKEYKRVFVTLPSGATAKQPPVQKSTVEQNTFTQYQPPVQKPLPEKKADHYQETIPSENLYEQKKEEVPKIAALKSPSYKSLPIEAVHDNTEDIYYPRKRSFTKRIGSMAAVVIGMIAMVALGIVIGLYINRKDGVSMVKKVETVPDKQITTPLDQKNETAKESRDQNILIIDSGKIEEALKPKNTHPTGKKTVVAAPDTNQQDVAISQTVKEEPQVLTEDEGASEKKPLSKPQMPELEKMISVSSNDYEVGPFGGISKLALTVKNTSEYDLNLVVVQLEYLKANKEVFKTENLYFRDVAANSSLTLEAPRSNRGNKINYKVTLINSKDHLFHAGN